MTPIVPKSIRVHVKSKIETEVSVEIDWPQAEESVMSEVFQLSGFTLGNGALGILLDVFRLFSRFSEPLTSKETFDAALNDAIGLLEKGVKLTPTDADDMFIAQVLPFVKNDIVRSVLWNVYKSLVQSPSLAKDMTPERLAGMIQAEAEKAVA